MWKRIVLTGFSGTGKSTVARLVASNLGWDVVDLDENLESHFGMSIPDVFEQLGEPAFRAAERSLLASSLSTRNVVIATGGGAVATEDAWGSDLLGDPETLTVTLDAQPEASFSRLQQQQEHEGSSAGRPMLAGNDPLERARTLKLHRQGYYDRARITIPVDNVGPEHAANTITQVSKSGDTPYGVTLNAPGGTSSIEIARGLLSHAGHQIANRWRDVRRGWIISDTNVAEHHAGRVQQSLGSHGIEASILTVSPGEQSKGLGTAGVLYDQLLRAGIERNDLIVALGGGVIGDLAGFVASTVLRGVRLIQIPTSLLAMVDSSVGGKTGINHEAGKNLIGSFYQPPLVLIDPDVLSTLPSRELRQGWAEIVKHAAIQPSTPGGERSDLMTYLERNVDRLLSLDEPATSYLIARNVALKAAVVEADEREAGIRAFLNFGHTLGHAVEASNYQYLHGEAVAIGMHGASVISTERGNVQEINTKRLITLIERFGLPVHGTFDRGRVFDLIKQDKKRAHGNQRWVLMSPDGGVTIDDEVPVETVHLAIERISS